ncbi:MAG TPA: crosslink repair DNA glycosylase YcaQ family protein [candidate division Zixibacteria bacterium]|nr:crosslink repair DNA glycosylase YcaQ family protein [candidate division Zixibacteria bacterium]
MSAHLRSQAETNCDPLAPFHPAVREWFQAVFSEPTLPQKLGWPAIAQGGNSLILAPTGSGKTLTAFLWCINQLMFSPIPQETERCRVVYVSPIKALTVDVERNLNSPLVGIAQAASRLGMEYHTPRVALRTGDTPSLERARFRRHPADILITTPESLYLLLTSAARRVLTSVETIIVDEIHAMVPSKRGAHLAVTIERLEHLCGRPLQRIGLSATQRPLDEVARFLGGALRPAESQTHATQENAIAEFETGIIAPIYRPVTIVDASEKKKINLRVEVPVEDMARLDEITELPSGPTSAPPVRPSIWSAIHPQLLELVRAHRSTLIFVNSRRLAERISGALNELAGETLVRAHHGSLAMPQRREIEDRLKMGTLRGLVATSSLELGIDMGAIDLVVQVESPPSVASGMQRVGRAGHSVGGTSSAVMYPKFRADLLACAAITRAMYEGQVESAHYPRNALDVVAQQIVAMVSLESWKVEDLFATIRRSAPFATLSREVFEGVLDMLAGRYPSDEFAELRPRITWDRATNTLQPREGAKSVAVINGGTIPDRGLYGVFLAGATKGARVGELDEEMVFESRTGDTIILGASTWRIEQITHDRVLVSPAPGEPGKMPFWHGDSPGRPSEFGEKIGRLTRELLGMPRSAAFTKLVEEHSLDENAAENLLRYLEDQVAATERVPSDEDIVVERCRDELGDWRVCVLTPFGARVHAPWCMAVASRLQHERGIEVETMWTDDGFVLRLPENEPPLESEVLFPRATELRDLVLRQLPSTAVFAAHFRESAARALLLPRRRPAGRTPLWQQRKRSADLLNVAARYPSFPILLESYRECIRDVFDLPATTDILTRVQQGRIRVSTVESQLPSPFASSLLFSYVANYIYDGDAPLAERRAQALAIDQSKLEELLGDNDLRELLDAAALDEVEAQTQSLAEDYRARHADGIHDLLLRLGDLSETELAARCESTEVAKKIDVLVQSRRALRVRIAGEWRFIAVEDAARYRDALGVPLPPGLAQVYLEHVPEALLSLVRRYARTHGPFTTRAVAARFGLAEAHVDPCLRFLHSEGKLLEGEFRPGGAGREWCDPDLLRTIRRKTLAKLRREIEPVEERTFARLVTRWQGTVAPRRGLEALLDAVESLQGAAMPASELEREILPARVSNYSPADLDTLMAAGEITWVGLERLGDRDGRIALYLTGSLPSLWRPPEATSQLSERAQQICNLLQGRGASFFPEIQAQVGGFPKETLDALWELVWAGLVTNDSLQPLRTLQRASEGRRARAGKNDPRPGSPEFLRRFRSRASGETGAHGRWSLLSQRIVQPASATEWSANIAQQLLARYGIVMRETAVSENIIGGYTSIYPALRTMEDSGWVRRGMFVAGMGAAQFATPAAVDMLRSLRTKPDQPETVHLAAADPANPYGALLPWPRLDDATTGAHGMARVTSASVVLINGSLAAFLRRKNPSLRVWLPEDEPDRTRYARALARRLAQVALERQTLRTGLLIGEINEQPAVNHFLAPFLEESGFVETALGFQMRRQARPAQLEVESEEDEEVETE